MVLAPAPVLRDLRDTFQRRVVADVSTRGAEGLSESDCRLPERDIPPTAVAQQTRDLPAAEATALRRSLAKHGVEVDSWGATPRAALEALGADNVTRLTADVVDAPRSETAKADAAIDSLRFVAIHNTSAHPKEDQAILCAALFEPIGGHGVHSSNAFNRTFLDSKQNVFALWLPTRGDHVPVLDNRYGDKSIVFDPTYFGHHGWISPYAMDPDDLKPIAREVLGEKRAEELPMDTSVFEGEPPSDWLDFRHELGRFDMTGPQFEEAAKRQLKSSMRRLYDEDRSEYELALRYLEAGSQRELEEVVGVHGYLPLFGNRFDTPHRREAIQTILEQLHPQSDLERRIRVLVEDPRAVDTLIGRRELHELHSTLKSLALNEPSTYPLTPEIDEALFALFPGVFDKFFEAKIPAAVPEHAHTFVPRS